MILSLSSLCIKSYIKVSDFETLILVTMNSAVICKLANQDSVFSYFSSSLSLLVILIWYWFYISFIGLQLDTSTSFGSPPNMPQPNWPKEGYGLDNVATICYNTGQLWPIWFPENALFNNKPRPKNRLQLRIPWNKEERKPIPTGPWRSSLHWQVWQKMPTNQIHLCCIRTQQRLWRSSWCENMEGEASGGHRWLCDDVGLNWTKLHDWIGLSWIGFVWSGLKWIESYSIVLNWIRLRVSAYGILFITEWLVFVKCVI